MFSTDIQDIIRVISTDIQDIIRVINTDIQDIIRVISTDIQDITILGCLALYSAVDSAPEGIGIKIKVVK